MPPPDCVSVTLSGIQLATKGKFEAVAHQPLDQLPRERHAELHRQLRIVSTVLHLHCITWARPLLHERAHIRAGSYAYKAKGSTSAPIAKDVPMFVSSEGSSTTLLASAERLIRTCTFHRKAQHRIAYGVANDRAKEIGA